MVNGKDLPEDSHSPSSANKFQDNMKSYDNQSYYKVTPAGENPPPSTPHLNKDTQEAASTVADSGVPQNTQNIKNQVNSTMQAASVSPIPQAAPTNASGENVQSKDEKTYDARKEIARAEVILGPRIGGGEKNKKISKGGCCCFVAVILLVPLALVTYYSWNYKPPVKDYPATPIKDIAKATRIGMNLGFDLPKEWKRQGTDYFEGPNGETLKIRYGDLTSLGMNPRTMNGKLVRDQYTPEAYLRSMLKRDRRIEGENIKRRIRKKPFEGVEVMVYLKKGGWIRSFVIVYTEKLAVEFKFYLPEGIDSQAGKDAEAIIKSLTGDLPPVVPTTPAPVKIKDSP